MRRRLSDDKPHRDAMADSCAYMHETQSFAALGSFQVNLGT